MLYCLLKWSKGKKLLTELHLCHFLFVSLRHTAGRSVARRVREESPGNTERHTS